MVLGQLLYYSYVIRIARYEPADLQICLITFEFRGLPNFLKQLIQAKNSL
jgi:hypothetical protein